MYKYARHSIFGSVGISWVFIFYYWYSAESRLAKYSNDNIQKSNEKEKDISIKQNVPEEYTSEYVYFYLY